MLFLIRLYFKYAAVLFPKLVGNQAFKMFQKVRKKDIRARELGFYDKATKLDIPSTSFDEINAYELGSPTGKLVVLVHGWDSNIGCMSMIIDRLVDLNYRVVGINLPGHATYSKSSTNLFESKNIVKEVLHYLNPTEKISIITHSFGSPVTSYAFSELDYTIDHMVFLTSPNKIVNFFLEFKKIINLGQKAYDHMCKITYDLLQEDINNLLVSTKLQQVNYDHILILHDKYDKVLPIQESIDIANSDDRIVLKSYEKIGHYRMLWNEDIVNETIDFINKVQ